MSYSIVKGKNSQFNTCAFCRANKKPWDHPMKNQNEEIICKELAEYKCPYCHKLGHTIKHCELAVANNQKREEREVQRQARWEQNQKVKKEEIQKKVDEEKKYKNNCWASRVMVNRQPELVNKMLKEDAEIREKIKKEEEIRRVQLEQEKEANKKLAKIRWETWYTKTMAEVFGLPEDYGDYKKGEFWEFRVEGRKYQGKDADSDLAKSLREDYENRSRFRQYLSTKYWHWIFHSEDTEDDCPYLETIRYKKYERREEEDRLQEELAAKREKDREDEKKEMKLRVKKGEITRQEYDDWKMDLEHDEDWAFEESGIRMYEQIDFQNRAYQQWEENKAEIEGDTGYKERKAEEARKRKEWQTQQIQAIMNHQK